jgi:hypothetical protein
VPERPAADGVVIRTRLAVALCSGLWSHGRDALERGVTERSHLDVLDFGAGSATDGNDAGMNGNHGWIQGITVSDRSSPHAPRAERR